MNPPLVLCPLDDGKTHINVYSKGETELGKLLSNFSNLPFDHPDYGRFESLEGFWYWIATGKMYDTLKICYGFQAKKEGKKYERVDDDNFENEIKFATQLKIEQSPYLKKLLTESTLPFVHYYYYGSMINPKVIEVSGNEWQIEYIELLRKKYQQK